MTRIIKFPLKVYVRDLFKTLKECSDENYQLNEDEMNTALYALSKQIPVDIKIHKPPKRGWKTICNCANCGREIRDVIDNYCYNCGQKLNLKI